MGKLIFQNSGQIIPKLGPILQARIRIFYSDEK